jgi:hypothetical protein
MIYAHPNQPTTGQLTALAQKFNTGKYGCGYMNPYEWHFAPFLNRPIRLLEMGVAAGASIQTWAEYFPQAKIYGVDISPPISCPPTWDNGRIEILQGNLEDPAFITSFLAQTGGKFDIVIDDAGHTMTQQKMLFQTFFPHVNSNGIYIVEDLHTSYWKGNFDGGWRKSHTMMSFLKELCDLPTYEAWREDKRCEDPPETLPFEKEIHSLHFYHGLCLIYRF